MCLSSDKYLNGRNLYSDKDNGVIYIVPPPNDKPIKIVGGNSWNLEGNENEIVASKRLSEMESKSLLMELFGTTDVGILDCSNMTEEEIAEIDRIVDEFNKIGCTSFQFTAEELKEILEGQYNA